MIVRRILLALLLFIPLGGAGPALGASAKPGLEADSPLPYELTVQGSAGTNTVLAPVPRGDRPLLLTGTVISTYEHPGDVWIMIGPRRGARVDATRGGAVEIQLDPSDVVDGAIPVGMRVRIKPDTDCFVGELGDAALKDATLTYEYPDSLPDTVAEFLSPGVASYTIETSADPSPAERTAALDAVAALTHRFAAPTDVRLRTGEGEPGTYLDRVIRFQEGPPTGGEANQVVVDRSGTLTVIGQGQDLADAAVALGDPTTDALRSPRVSDLRAGSASRVVDSQVAWSALDLAGIDLSGVGRMEADVTVTQAMFGTSLSGLILRVRGGVTSLPDHGEGRIDLLWNGEVVSSVNITDAVTLDRTIDVATADLARVNTLTIRLSFVPPERDCLPPPLGPQLTVNPDISTMTPEAGQSEPPGFDRFPQVVASELPVGFGPGSPGALLPQAADLVAALQSETPSQLVPAALTEQEFLLDERPGVLVGASEETTRSLAAPLRGDSGTWQGPGPEGFTASQTRPLAYLQAFSAQGRDIVMLGVYPGDDALAGELAAYAASQPDPWLKLPGQVVILQPDSGPVPLDLTQPPETPSVTAPIIVTLAILGLLIVLLGWWLWKRPGGPAPPIPGKG